MRKRKTRDVWDFYVDYGGGWEYEYSENSLSDAKRLQKEYSDNYPQYPTRIVRRREKIKEDGRI